MRLASLILAGALLAPAAALAQMAPAPAPAPAAPATCATMDAELPAELTGWTTKTPLAAAGVAADLAKAALVPGKAYQAALPSTPAVAYLLQPEKPGGSVSHGGLFELTVQSAGTYVIALGTAAWIDLLKDGAPLVSSSHGRGPACSTLRKMVTFDLQPGRYVVQISANGPAELPIMVAKRP
jgi:hypothetical protein